jgi:hypothetical protein
MKIAIPRIVATGLVLGPADVAKLTNFNVPNDATVRGTDFGKAFIDAQVKNVTDIIDGDEATFRDMRIKECQALIRLQKSNGDDPV